MTVFVAPAELSELDALIASAAGLFAEDAGVRDPLMDLGWPERSGADYYRNLIESPDALAVLAFTNPQRHEVIGHLTGALGAPNQVRHGARIATLQSLRVHPDHRRIGVAGALVDAFDAWAEATDAAEAAVTAYTSNAGAIAFYRSRGFLDYDVTLHRTLHRAAPR